MDMQPIAGKERRLECGTRLLVEFTQRIAHFVMQSGTFKAGGSMFSHLDLGLSL